MPVFCHATRSLLCCALLGLGLMAGHDPAWGQSSRSIAQATGTTPLPSAQDEIARLVRAGQLDEASDRIAAILKDNPTHPQMRFLKGMLESERGQKAEAYATFQQLTQDYPELPEPYNNLAVLEAANSRLPEALALLETAVRLDPDYAIAHQNLGDVQARLAARSYARALELDPANPALRPRLNVLQTLLASPVPAR
jgi:Flp pilus assembly protein TadD